MAAQLQIYSLSTKSVTLENWLQELYCSCHVYAARIKPSAL